MDNSTSHGLEGIVLRTIFVPLISLVSTAAIVYFRTLPLSFDILLLLAVPCLTSFIQFSSEVMRQIGGRIIKGTENWLLVVIRDMYSRHYRRYCNLILSKYQHGDAQSRIGQAISLPLPRVFVEPFITPLDHQLEASTEERQFIWHYLIPPSAIPRQDFVILGERGSGKTSLLKHLAIAVVTDKKQRRKFKVPYRLPIFLPLRNHAKAIGNDPALTLAQVIRYDLFDHESTRHDIPSRWIEGHLKKGHCLILLDGLDEVADDDTLENVVAWIQRQRVIFAKNSFIISSRPTYSHDTFTGVTLLENHFFDANQRKRYIEKWSRAYETGRTRQDTRNVQIHADNQTEELLQRLQDDKALEAPEISPLQLIMATSVHLHSNKPIQKQMDIHSRALHAFLSPSQQAHPAHTPAALTASQKQHILQMLAYHMMCATQQDKRFTITLDEAVNIIAGPLAAINASISPIDFLEMIRTTSGLLMKQKKDTYSFAHRTFQECLAAFHVKDQNLEYELMQHLHDSWWHDTIILYSSQSNEPAAVITACFASHDTLLLASKCLTEADLALEERKNLEDQLDQALEKADPQQQRPIIKARLDRRWQHMVELSEDWFIDTSLITYAEYQLFLNDQRPTGKYHQPDHWETPQFSPNKGKDPVLGLRPADAEAFAQWFATIQPGKWHCHLPTAREINHTKARGVPQHNYWMLPAGDNYACSGQPDVDIYISPTMLNTRVNADLQRARGYLRLINLKRALDCLLDPALDHKHPLDLDHILNRTLTPPAFTKQGSSWIQGHNDELLSVLQSKLDPTLGNLKELDDLPDFAKNLIAPLVADLQYLRALINNKDTAFTSIQQRAPTSAPDMNEQTSFLRWYIRLFALVILDYYLNKEPSPQTRRERLLRSHTRQNQEQAANQKIIDTYRDLYIHMALLEERMPGGNLKPFEGLLLVRARRGQTEEE